MEAGGYLVKGQTLDGYPSLTQFISRDHDRTTLVFKRFDRLAIRNLLYIQSELAELQTRQDIFDVEDYSVHADMEAKACAMSWERSKKMAASGDSKRIERISLAKEIRNTIKEYRKRLVPFGSSMVGMGAYLELQVKHSYLRAH
jgi:hypothetical protein